MTDDLNAAKKGLKKSDHICKDLPEAACSHVSFPVDIRAAVWFHLSLIFYFLFNYFCRSG